MMDERMGIEGHYADRTSSTSLVIVIDLRGRDNLRSCLNTRFVTDTTMHFSLFGSVVLSHT